MKSVNKKVKTNWLVSIAVLILLYFNLTLWQQSFLGWGLTILYFLATSCSWQKILKKVYGFRQSDWINKTIAIFAILFLVSFFSGVFVVWYKLTSLTIWLSFFLSAVVTFVLEYAVQKNKKVEFKNKKNIYSKGFKQDFFRKKNIFVFIYIILWFVGLVLLSRNNNTEIMFSPWQGIGPWFLPLFFLLTLLLGYFVFSKYSIKTVLFFILLHSLLLHLYLPLSHQLPWGGDVWRHMAVEQKLINGEPELPILFGGEINYESIGGIVLPEVFLSPHKYLYGMFWGSSTVLTKSLNTNLISFNIWYLPIVWSIFFPVILFRIGALLFSSWRRGLLLSALGSLPFTFQAVGSFTLPVSLGYLFFFFILLLWLVYLKDGLKWQKIIALFFAVTMIFGYTLHFILIWFVIITSWLLKLAVEKKYNFFKNSLNRKSFYTILFFLSMFFWPVFEIFAKISYVPYQINLLENIKHFVGQFSGWYYAALIRPHDILSGNIIFNHTPSYSFVSSLFTDFRWHIVLVMILLWVFAKYAVLDILNKNNLLWKVIATFSFSIIGGYIIGWFVLSGDRSFVRRLDATLAFVLLLLFLYGVSTFFNNYKIKYKKYFKPLVLTIFIIIFSISTTTSLASGPDSRVVSQSEYLAAETIWGEITHDTKINCVLADSWTLLALEYFSAKQIIGGGFPIDYQFGQPERIALFNQMVKSPEESVLVEIKKSTNSEQCIFAVQKEVLSIDSKKQINKLFNTESIEIGDQLLWLEYLPKEG